MGYIKSKKEILLTEDEVEKICDQLHALKDNTTRKDYKLHISSLKERYSSDTVCPKCGGDLLERTVHNGVGAGQKFIGCKNYPRCHYTRELKAI